MATRSRNPVRAAARTGRSKSTTPRVRLSKAQMDRAIARGGAWLIFDAFTGQCVAGGGSRAKARTVQPADTVIRYVDFSVRGKRA